MKNTNNLMKYELQFIKDFIINHQYDIKNIYEF